jgi:hypothetical protein
MTFAPEPADDIAAPRDPASYGPPRHLFSRGFIAVMVFGLVCILAGAAFTLFIPKLFPPKADSPPAAATPSPAPARAALQSSATPPLQADAPAPDAEVAALQQRALARVLYLFSSIIVVRRVDDVNGNGADAVLARAGRQASEGDLEGALDSLRALPPKALTAFADWREEAEARVEIDRRITAVRQAALGDLTQSIRAR